MTNDLQIHEAVVESITQILKDRGGEIPQIENNSHLADELQLESLDFILLIEQLDQHYEHRIDFMDWMTELAEADQLFEIRVTDVVEFIANQVKRF